MGLCCKKVPSPWIQAAALFEAGSFAEVLLSDYEKYSKEIAAFFVIQFLRLRWPIPDAICGDKEFKIIIKEFRKYLNMPKTKWWKEYAGKNVLFLAKDQGNSIIPEHILGARIYHISYLFAE
jgi:hypothetical protein